MRGPDRAKAIEKYRRAARGYDRRWARLSQPLRHRVVGRLSLRPGDTVIDVACGTGLSFGLLERAIGPEGRLIGVDLSPEMLSRARARAEAGGWDNVTLIEAPVEEAQIPGYADAAVFVFTHDVMRTAAAVSNVVRSVKHGGTVAATGLRRGPRWAFPLNAAIRAFARVGVTTTEGLDHPWSHLAPLVEDLRVQTSLLGYVYVLRARIPMPRGSVARSDARMAASKSQERSDEMTDESRAPAPSGSGPHGVEALRSFLTDEGVEFEVVSHEHTVTARAEARASGMDPQTAAKTVVVRSDDDLRMCVVPASERLDLAKVRDLVGVSRHHLRLATEAEISDAFPSYEVGAVPPIGPQIAPELVDQRLLDHDRVLCSGGDHDHGVMLDPRDIVRVAGAQVVDICQEP